MAIPAEAGLQIAEAGIEPLKLRQILRLAAANNRPVRDVGVRSRSASCPSRLGHRRLFRVAKGQLQENPGWFNQRSISEGEATATTRP